MPTQEQQLEATLRTALKREPPPTEVTTAAQGPLAGRSADRAAFVLKVERIRPDADQVRRMRKGVDDSENRELAESIRQFGLQKALNVAQNLSPEAKTEVQAADRKIGMESVYEVAQVPSEEQLPLVRRIVTEGLNRDQVRQLTSPAKVAQRHARHSKGGRPATAKPYCRTFKTANGATVTIAFRKARASQEEVAGALRSALKQLSA